MQPLRGLPGDASTCSPASARAAADKKTLYDLPTGKIDLIIGTHKLLQKDVQFKDLGLLIVDEEQRFGVTHKERLKELSPRRGRLNLIGNADPAHAQYGALAASATCPPSRSRRRTAIRCRPSCSSTTRRHSATRPCAASCARGGQVYYLHNRVETIEQCAAQASSRSIPEARDRRRPRQDERGAARRRHAAMSERRDPDPRLHDHHRDRHRHPERQHAHH